MDSMLRFFKRRQDKQKESLLFLKNGSMVLEGIASVSNYRYDVPYRNFTIKEIITATENFGVPVVDDRSGTLFRGSFQQRPILVKRYYEYFHEYGEELPSYINHDIVITLMMSHHKNVLRFLGCCLGFYAPVLVYECTGHYQLLGDILYNSKNHTTLSWKNRLKIATDVGNALAYLHTAFATPIIHRDLCPKNIMLDQFGVAKLLDFSLCIPLPPGETRVVSDRVVGRTSYFDPVYTITGIVTERSDVYLFGILLAILVTGKRWMEYRDGDIVHLLDHIDKDCLSKALDMKVKGDEAIEEQVQAVMELALRCTQPKEEDRPNMIDVAKELSRN